MSVHQGQRLEQLIKETGVRKGDVAKLLSMSRQNLHKMYKREKLNRLHIEKLCDHFNVPMEYFDSEKPIEVVKEPGEIYGSMSIKEYKLKLQAAMKEIQYLNRIIADKEQIIADKERQIQLMGGK